MRISRARGDAARRSRASRAPSRTAGAELAPILAAHLHGTLSMDMPLRPLPPPTPPASSYRGDAKTARVFAKFAIKVVAAETLKKPDVDPRARAVVAALLRDQEDPARAPPAHGVRGSVVPEHRRVLRQGHGDVHDHGRHLHARAARSATSATAGRCRSTPTSRVNLARDDRSAEAALRRDHERRPRRPARRRRAAFRRLHPRGARAFARDADRGAGARFPRPARPRARHPRRARRPT